MGLRIFLFAVFCVLLLQPLPTRAQSPELNQAYQHFSEHFAANRIAAAAPFAERALKLAESEFGEDDDNTVNMLFNLSAVYGLLGRLDEGIALGRRALAALEKNHGNGPELAPLLDSLADLQLSAGNVDQAELLLVRLQAIAQAAAKPEIEAAALEKLGQLDLQAGRHEEAATRYHQALTIHERGQVSDGPAGARALAGIATALARQGKRRHAADHFRVALKRAGDDAALRADILGRAAEAEARAGRYVAAARQLRESLVLVEKALGAEHPALIEPLGQLGEVERAAGQYERAEAALRRALALVERAYGSTNGRLASALFQLAEVLRAQERYDEAKPLLVRARAIMAAGGNR